MSFKDFVNEQSTELVTYLFVDFDGTIRDMGGHMAPASFDEVHVFRWAHNRLQEARNKGYFIVGITNQRRLVEKLSVSTVDAICQETVRQLGIDFPYFFAHTQEQSKPSAYMLEQAEIKYGKADKTTSLFVGDDLYADAGCAANFGIQFMTAEDFKTHGVY